MKNASKIVTLLGFLLVVVLIVSQINAVNGAGLNISDAFYNLNLNLGNRVRLTELYLSTTGNSAGILVNGNKIKLLNGLIVYGDESYRTVGEAQMSTVAGGSGNVLIGTQAGIVGGAGNHLSGNISVIGGGSGNSISSGLNAVIAGGSLNTGLDGAIILGGSGNNASKSAIILGGFSNESQGENSLVMGSRAKGSDRTFVWKSGQTPVFVQNSSAYVEAAKGVLIGTYQPKNGVDLVVSGAVKMGSSELSNGLTGEIMMTGGCFYVYDGKQWHVLGTDSASGGSACINSSINLSKTCRFGNKLLKEGDKAVAYSATYSTNCNELEKDVVCTGGQLVASGGSTGYSYPYCYEISGRPVVLGQNDSNPAEPSEGNVLTAMLDGNDPEMNNFSYSIISINRPAGLTDADGPKRIIIMDRNLGAITDDVTDADSYGYKYQWGNNYGFSDSISVNAVEQGLTWDNSYNNHGYRSTDMIIGNSANRDVWSGGSHHPGLWGGANDGDENNRGAKESNPTDRQGPCPDGWHVPSAGEWGLLVKYWGENNDKTVYGYHGLYNLGEGQDFQNYFKLPFAGGWEFGTLSDVGSEGQYWSSSPTSSDGNDSYYLRLVPSNVNAGSLYARVNAYSVRCFKN